MKRHSDALDLNPNAELSPADAEFAINYQCFIRTLDLFAETCLHRNKENQKKLAPIFENKLLIAIF